LDCLSTCFSHWPCRLSSQWRGRKNMDNSMNKKSSSSKRSNLVITLTTVFLSLPLLATLLALISSMTKKWNSFAAWTFFRFRVRLKISLQLCLSITSVH
jgi:hypothetical protein